MVAAGSLIMAAVERAGTHLVPVDSEHNALHQLLDGETVDHVARLILTASGGPFRSWSRRAMEKATVHDALDHPTWRMGAKITVDSATLMNKGLEVIEAHYLFGVPEENIEILVHPQSLVHGMVEWVDGSITAQMAPPDMRLPIAHALYWPQRTTPALCRLDLTQMSGMTFEEPDRDRFPALDLARAALRAGGEMPAVLNAANEAAVQAFLAGRCSFPAVSAAVADTLDAWSAVNRPPTDIGQILAVDEKARKLTMEKIVKYDRSVKYGAPVHGSEKRC
jgi:1-deoxy-D-xylulose-5-phosphate reductoisomerase